VGEIERILMVALIGVGIATVVALFFIHREVAALKGTIVGE